MLHPDFNTESHYKSATSNSKISEIFSMSLGMVKKFPFSEKKLKQDGEGKRKMVKISGKNGEKIPIIRE